MREEPIGVKRLLRDSFGLAAGVLMLLILAMLLAVQARLVEAFT